MIKIPLTNTTESLTITEPVQIRFRFKFFFKYDLLTLTGRVFLDLINRRPYLKIRPKHMSYKFISALMSFLTMMVSFFEYKVAEKQIFYYKIVKKYFKNYAKSTVATFDK